MDYTHLMKDNKHKKVWQHLFIDKIGRFVQEVGQIVKGTDTIF